MLLMVDIWLTTQDVSNPLKRETIYGINQWPQMAAFWDLDCHQQDHLGVLLRLCWQPDILNCLHRDYSPVIEKFPSLSRRFLEQKLAQR